MNSYSIGCDPDSKYHGIAVYKNGNLVDLQALNLMHFMDLLLDLKKDGSIHVHIENMNGKKAVWHAEDQSKKSYGMASQNVAKCKQAQIEVERMLDKLGVPYTHHNISSAWKSQAERKQFEAATGWKGTSTKDTRSAAYFGFIGLGSSFRLMIAMKPYIPKSAKRKTA